MDRSIIEKHLALAENHVALGEQHLAAQRAIVAHLERDGHSTARALDLLETFQKTQAVHVEGRDRLKRELAAARHRQGNR